MITSLFDSKAYNVERIVLRNSAICKATMSSKYKRKAKVVRKKSKRSKPSSTTIKNRSSIIEALSKPLPVSNKGFQMLKGMGWEGGGLGKTGNKGLEIPVPINIPITSNLGIGKSTELLQHRKERTIRSAEDNAKIQKSFQTTGRRNFYTRKAKKILSSLRKLCQNLDLNAGVSKSPYWNDIEVNLAKQHNPNKSSTQSKITNRTATTTERTPVELCMMSSEDISLEISKIKQYLKKKYEYDFEEGLDEEEL